MRSVWGGLAWWLLLGIGGEGQVVRLSRHAPVANLALNTISVTAAPSQVNFALVSGGVSAGSQPVAITTSWLLGLASTVKLYGFFGSQTALTGQNSGASIPASSLLGSCPTGVAAGFAGFSQVTPLGGGGGLLLMQQGGLVSLAVTRTDNLTLRIDLSQLPQLPADTYSGVLLLQAQAF